MKSFFEIIRAIYRYYFRVGICGLLFDYASTAAFAALDIRPAARPAEAGHRRPLFPLRSHRPCVDGVQTSSTFLHRGGAD